jgi:hypothetical protein
MPTPHDKPVGQNAELPHSAQCVTPPRSGDGTLVTAGDFCWSRHLLFDLVLVFTRDARHEYDEEASERLHS